MPANEADLSRYPVVRNRVLVIGGAEKAAKHLRANPDAVTLSVRQYEQASDPSLSLVVNWNPLTLSFLERHASLL